MISYIAKNRTVSRDLLQTAEKALSAEEDNVREGMEKLLKNNAESFKKGIRNVGIKSYFAVQPPST